MVSQMVRMLLKLGVTMKIFGNADTLLDNIRPEAR